MRRGRRRKTRRELKNRKIFLSSFILLCIMAVGWGAFQTTISLNVRGHVVCSAFGVSKLKESVANSGDGLYLDSYEEGRYIYRGTNPNNYIKLDDDSFRIIGVENDGSLKVVRANSVGRYNYGNSSAEVTKYWGSNKTMRDINNNYITQAPIYSGGSLVNLPDNEAAVNVYLNSTWYNSLSSRLKSKIVNHIFNNGLVSYNRKTISDVTEQEKTYKWEGRIGLIYLSDYFKGSTNESCLSIVTENSYHNSSEQGLYCSINNYLYTYKNIWTMTPTDHNYKDYVWFINDSGRADFSRYDGQTSNQGYYDIYPVFYLSRDIKLCGEGTSEEPYYIIGK